VRNWPLRTRDGRQATFDLKQRMTLSDPEAACHAAMQGLGVTLVSTVHALPFLQRGSLQRVLPDWYVDTGGLSLYFSAQKLLPAKTRVFIDFIVERFREQRLAERFNAHWPIEPDTGGTARTRTVD
jgi:DNA-binding transcriptional LysR family regulator